MLRSGGSGTWGAWHYVAPQVRVTECDASKVSLSALFFVLKGVLPGSPGSNFAGREASFPSAERFVGARSSRHRSHAVLDGPTEFVMGGSVPRFEFAPGAETRVGVPPVAGYRAWGSNRVLSNLKSWLTQISNTSVYQGYHDWHTDGPAHYGRYHKLFVMVDKPGHEAKLERTNVRLVPASSLNAHRCALGDVAAEPAVIDAHWFNATWPRSKQNAAPPAAEEGKRRAWGVTGDWHGLEALSCPIPMAPGDLLFFREDVWHRTQDMELDRTSFIMDVLRFPLEEVRYAPQDVPYGCPPDEPGPEAPTDARTKHAAEAKSAGAASDGGAAATEKRERVVVGPGGDVRVGRRDGRFV